MKLVLKKCAGVADWYSIEKSDEDHGHIRDIRPVVIHGIAMSAFYDSARVSDACVEGTAAEMRDIATAIEKRTEESHNRCAVDASTDRVRFWSPRNSYDDDAGIVSREVADGLAKMIREMLPEPGTAELPSPDQVKP